MLIDLGVACAWIAMSVAGAIGLSSLAGFGVPATAAAGVDDEVELGHEDVYALEPLPPATSWKVSGATSVGLPKVSVGSPKVSVGSPLASGYTWTPGDDARDRARDAAHA